MQRRRKLFLFFLIFFALTSSFVDFFHTETTLEPDDENCPACIFRNSFFSTTAVFHCFLTYIAWLVMVIAMQPEEWVRRLVVHSIRNKSPPAFFPRSACPFL